MGFTKSNIVHTKNSTPETRFSDPRFSEILDLVNKTQLPSFLFITMTQYSE